MGRLRSLWILGAMALTAAHMPFGMLYAADSSSIQYEVLSPWAEADPKPLKGISPRPDNLSGKKIGLFANYKRAAMPIARSLQEKISAAYPDSEVSIYHSDRWNVDEIETDNREKFTEWVKGNDAVILMIGD